MKFNATLFATALTSALLMSSAYAADGTINFEGELIDQTCDITVDGQTTPANVVLPTVSVNNLASAGKTTGRTGFNIELKNCTGATTVSTAAAFFENGATVDTTTFRLINTAVTDAAGNVQLELLDAKNDAVINVGNQNQNTNSSFITVADNAAVLPYAVQYYALGATTPGAVTSQVNFSVNYQ